jgi:hypothetical protein
MLPLLFVGALVWWGIQKMRDSRRDLNRRCEAQKLLTSYVKGEDVDTSRAERDAKTYRELYERIKSDQMRDARPSPPPTARSHPGDRRGTARLVGSNPAC